MRWENLAISPTFQALIARAWKLGAWFFYVLLSTARLGHPRTPSDTGTLPRWIPLAITGKSPRWFSHTINAISGNSGDIPSHIWEDMRKIPQCPASWTWNPFGSGDDDFPFWGMMIFWSCPSPKKILPSWEDPVGTPKITRSRRSSLDIHHFFRWVDIIEHVDIIGLPCNPCQG